MLALIRSGFPTKCTSLASGWLLVLGLAWCHPAKADEKVYLDPNSVTIQTEKEYMTHILSINVHGIPWQRYGLLSAVTNKFETANKYVVYLSEEKAKEIKSQMEKVVKKAKSDGNYLIFNGSGTEIGSFEETSVSSSIERPEEAEQMLRIHAKMVNELLEENQNTPAVRKLASRYPTPKQLRSKAELEGLKKSIEELQTANFTLDNGREWLAKIEKQLSSDPRLENAARQYSCGAEIDPGLNGISKNIDFMKQALESYLNDKEDKWGCNEPKPGHWIDFVDAAYYDGASGKSYRLIHSAKDPKLYYVDLNLNFTLRDNDGYAINDARIRKQYFSDLFAHMGECIKKINQKLTDPDGQRIELRYYDSENDESPDVGPPSKISINVYLGQKFRQSSGKWWINIDCETMSHELMHRLGLPDEYEEYRTSRLGYFVDENGNITDEKTRNFVHLYDCRSIGRSDSVMNNQWEAFETTFAPDGGSLLYPGQFRFITHKQDCLERSSDIYFKCIQNERRTSTKEGCLPVPEACRDGKKWEAQ